MLERKSHRMTPHAQFLRLLAVTTLAVALAACSSPRETRGDAATSGTDAATAGATLPYTIERDRRDLRIADDTTRVRIVNAYGNVVVRNVGERLVGMQATEQRIGKTPEAAQITLALQGTTALLEVAYPSEGSGSADGAHDPHEKGRVDLAVFVPLGVMVEIEATFGSVDIRRINNDLSARTVSGRLVAASTGSMTLETDSGDLRAWPMAGKWKHPMVLRSKSGSIFSDVPGYGEIALEARSRGTIEADFAVTRMTKDDVNVVRYTNGGGSQKVSITSETGPISLQFASRPPTPE
jgi:hypothetical protein